VALPPIRRAAAIEVESTTGAVAVTVGSGSWPARAGASIHFVAPFPVDAHRPDMRICRIRRSDWLRRNMPVAGTFWAWPGRPVTAPLQNRINSSDAFDPKPEQNAV